MHGELSGCYDRSVSDRNQLPDLTYEEISRKQPARRGEEKKDEFGNEWAARPFNIYTTCRIKKETQEGEQLRGG